MSPVQSTRLPATLVRLQQFGVTLAASRRKLATGAAALLALTVGYHVVFGHNGLTAYQAKRQNIRDLAVQTEDLRRENDALQQHVNRLTADPNAIEHEARESLHYTRPGEVIYTMPDDNKQPAPQQQ